MEEDDALEAFGREFRSPGHVPICLSSPRPLEDRFGHTELSVSLLKLAGLVPVALGCEIMGDGGGAKPKEETKAYAEEHDIPFLDGQEIVLAWRESSGSCNGVRGLRYPSSRTSVLP